MNIVCMRAAGAAAFGLSMACAAASAMAAPYAFSTGDPDGKIATASRPDSAGKIEIEAADDFILGSTTSIASATFSGLLTGDLPTVGGVAVEIYRVFPNDSVEPPSGHVPTRANSPSDVAFTTRSAAAGELSFVTAALGPFTALNSVLNNGIHPVPGQFTGGDGSASGQEVRFDIAFATPLLLPADHYFFVPQVEVGNGEFLWLSAPKPIVAGTGPFVPDLQSWIRDENLAPDWLRVGTDITHQGPFNAAFSLAGTTVAAIPEPETYALMLAGLGLLAAAVRRRS